MYSKTQFRRLIHALIILLTFSVHHWVIGRFSVLMSDDMSMARLYFIGLPASPRPNIRLSASIAAACLASSIVSPKPCGKQRYDIDNARTT